MERRFDRRWSEEATVSGGRKVTLRTVRPEDALLLAEGFEKLSPESRFRRFHAVRGPLSADELKYLTDLDGEGHFALGALDAKTGEGLGIARFVRLEDAPQVAEPAVAVVDSAQQSGLGRLLMLRLAAAAQERWIESFRCFVLADNQPMRNLLTQLGLATQPKRDGQVLQFDFPLSQMSAPAPAPREHHPLHQFLMAAATGAFVLAELADHVRHWITDQAGKPRPDAPTSSR
jgi:ribosomal protein S18 acetylase RimI-like enzyme